MMNDEDRILDPAFAALRAEPPRPSEALMERVVAAGSAVQPQARRPQAAGERTRMPPVRSGRFFDGWTLSGLVTACVVGLVVGMTGVIDLSSDPYGDTIDLLPLAEAPFGTMTEEN